MNRNERQIKIAGLCELASCSDNLIKVHYAQFVDRRWNPHAPSDFAQWWKTHSDHTTHGIDLKRAYNCQRYRDEYMEAKKYGVA